MARRDLEELRAEIAWGARLSPAESRALTYYGEDRLREILSLFAGITEAETEYESEQEAEHDDDMERRERLADDGYEDFYDDDEYGIWEVEITVNYGDDF